MIFDRTFHPDEANQAFTVGRLLETGRYAYRPTDHHGPTLYYAAAPLQRAFGHATTAELDGTLLRCTPLLFGALALVFGALALRKVLAPIQRRAVPALFAAVLGTSPLFVFFATDFIQETLLASFLTMAFWAGVGYFTARAAGAQPTQARVKPGTWALLLGIACGLAFATKETSVLSFAAAGVAGLPLLWRHRKDVRLESRDVVLAAAGFLLTAVLFFSSFATNWVGVYNAFVAAPLSYFHRAAGDAASEGAAWHVHPFGQYLKWLFSGNGMFALFVVSVLAAAVFVCARPASRGAVRPATRRALAFLSAYSALLLLLYSAIPYKTPWCAVQMLVAILPASLLGLAALQQKSLADYAAIKADSPRLAAFLSFMPIVAMSALLVFFGNVPALVVISRDPDSRNIPYNYASASPEAKELAATVAAAMDAAERRAKAEGLPPPFAAVALPPTDTWPFPWYNRRHESKTGYWTKFDDLVALERGGSKPAVVVVPMAEGHLAQALFPHLKNTRRFYMRPGVRVRVFW